MTKNTLYIELEKLAHILAQFEDPALIDIFKLRSKQLQELVKKELFNPDRAMLEQLK